MSETKASKTVLHVSPKTHKELKLEAVNTGLKLNHLTEIVISMGLKAIKKGGLK